MVIIIKHGSVVEVIDNTPSCGSPLHIIEYNHYGDYSVKKDFPKLFLEDSLSEYKVVIERFNLD